MGVEIKLKNNRPCMLFSPLTGVYRAGKRKKGSPQIGSYYFKDIEEGLAFCITHVLDNPLEDWARCSEVLYIRFLHGTYKGREAEDFIEAWDALHPPQLNSPKAFHRRVVGKRSLRNKKRR